MSKQTCKKAAFETLKEAMKRAKQINRENKANDDDTVLRAYFCPVCKKHHLTSKVLGAKVIQGVYVIPKNRKEFMDEAYLIAEQFKDKSS